MALPQPDIELLRRAQKGDHAAFREIMDVYQGPVFNYVLRMLAGDRALAEDMCQEVFLRVYRTRDYQPTAKFRSWLFRIATNLAISVASVLLVNTAPLFTLAFSRLVLGETEHGEAVELNRRAAESEGLRSLRESALMKVFAGVSTLHEINRVTFVEEVSAGG